MNEDKKATYFKGFPSIFQYSLFHFNIPSVGCRMKGF